MTRRDCLPSRARLSACALLLATLSTAVYSTLSVVTSMQISTLETPYGTQYRMLTARAADTTDVVMSNCSSALTLTDNCCNTSDTRANPAPLVCVGSTTTQTCPQHATLLNWSYVWSAFPYMVDGSTLGIERVVINSFTKIQSLILNDNKLTQLRLPCWLDKLEVATNRFASFEDIAIPHGVRVLNVAHNTLQRIVLSDAMTELKSLDATNGSLEQLDLSNATALVTVIAPFNKLTTIASVSRLTRVEHLDLAHNAIVDWTSFVPSHELRVLNASHNGVTQMPQGNWSSLAPKLEVLNFSFNAITSTRDMSWPARLRELDLRGNPLEVIEIFDSDVTTFQQLESFLVPDRAVSATSESCATRNATLQKVAAGVTVCVVAATGASSTHAPGSANTANHEASSTSSSSFLNVVILSVSAVGLVALLAVGVLFRRRRLHASANNHKDASMKRPRTQIARLHSSAVADELASLRADDALVASLINATDATEVRVLDDSGVARVTLVRVGENVFVRKQIRESFALQDAHAVLALAREIRAAAPLEHAKIVPFRGFTCTSALDLSLYSAYMANGSLASLLKLYGAQASHRSTFPWVASASTDDPVARLDLAIDVAEALVYLHSFDPPAVHGNVRAKNVLIDATWRARLGGVGLRIEPHEFDSVPRGAVAWLAPEILRGATNDKTAKVTQASTPVEQDTDEQDARDVYTPASDVYAFGVFLAELDACGAQPFGRLFQGTAQRTNTQLAHEIATNELKPLFHAECPDRVRALAQQCLAAAADARPSAMKVYYELSQLRKQLRKAAAAAASSRPTAVQQHISV